MNSGAGFAIGAFLGWIIGQYHNVLGEITGSDNLVWTSPLGHAIVFGLFGLILTGMSGRRAD